MSDLVSEKTIAAVEGMEARQEREAQMRLDVIRDICNREGHGRLIDVGTTRDLPHTVVHCQRGCGLVLYRPALGTSLESFLEYLQLRNITGIARFADRGFVEIEVES